MIPGPGTRCAFVMCDHEAILCTPEAYCRDTVLPVTTKVLFVSRTLKGPPAALALVLLTDICKLPVLKDVEIELAAESRELFDQVHVEILHNVDMSLNKRMEKLG